MYKENSKLLVGGFGRFCFKNITSSAGVAEVNVQNGGLERGGFLGVAILKGGLGF